jgi:hypothetical protein
VQKYKSINPLSSQRDNTFLENYIVINAVIVISASSPEQTVRRGYKISVDFKGMDGSLRIADSGRAQEIERCVCLEWVNVGGSGD